MLNDRKKTLINDYLTFRKRLNQLRMKKLQVISEYRKGLDRGKVNEITSTIKKLNNSGGIK